MESNTVKWSEMTHDQRVKAWQEWLPSVDPEFEDEDNSFEWFSENRVTASTTFYSDGWQIAAD